MVDPIVTMPMEAGSGVMVVVVFILLENNGEIGTESPHFASSSQVVASLQVELHARRAADEPPTQR